mgnify:CR=1 FL=1
MLISLRDLFALVAYCAALAWFGAFFGIEQEFFWISLGLVGILSCFFVWSASDDSRRGFTPWIVGTFVVLGGLLLAPAVLADALLLLVAGGYCAYRSSYRVRTLTVVAMVCSILALGAAALPGLSYGRQLDEMRRTFPIEDLSSRLSYEVERFNVGSEDDLDFSNDVFQGLVDEESHLEEMGNYRDRFLRLIHDREYERFIRSNGFGVARMPRPSLRRLNETPLTDIGYHVDPQELARHGEYSWRMPYDFAKGDEIDELHTASRRDFLHPDGFGAVIEPRQQMVGFIEHGFHYPPLSFMENPEVWTLERLELVSLLKFDAPRVYVLDHLPRMDQLQGTDIPTRDLDVFETAALAKLWTEEDVVISDAGEHGRVRMLGTLRATKECLDCHNVQRGTLLGAFSYVLSQEILEGSSD